MEYVQQFSPERVPEQEQQEEDEEDDDPLINYLRTFSYVQGAPALGVAEPNLMDLCLCILLILDEAVPCSIGLIPFTSADCLCWYNV